MTDSCVPDMTPSARRVVERCRAMFSHACSSFDANSMLLEELFGSESLAVASLNRLGITDRLLTAEREESMRHPLYDVCTSAHDDPDEFVAILDRARAIARRRGNIEGISTEDLLMAAAEFSPNVQARLAEHNVTVDALRQDLFGHR